MIPAPQMLPQQQHTAVVVHTQAVPAMTHRPTAAQTPHHHELDPVGLNENCGGPSGPSYTDLLLPGMS